MTDGAATGGVLAGKVAVVSGVGPGLGRATALAFAHAGATLVLAARDTARLAAIESAVREAGAPVLAVPTDITDDDARERLLATALDAFGALDVLVNNAFTMGPMARAAELTPTDWRAVFEVNVVATVSLSARAGSLMAERGGGSIVVVNSQAARRGAARRGPYAASKAAMLSAAQVLASELGPSGVRVNSVVPGQIWGDALEQHYEQIAQRRGTSSAEVLAEVVRDIPLRRIASGDEVAAAILFLASDAASAITGQTLDVNAGNWFA